MARLLLVLCIMLSMMVCVASVCDDDSDESPVETCDIWGTLKVTPKEVELNVGVGTSVEAEASFSALYDRRLDYQSGWLWKWSSDDGGVIEFTNGDEMHWTHSAAGTYTAMALCKGIRAGTVVVYVEQPTDQAFITFKVKNSHTCTITVSE